MWPADAGRNVPMDTIATAERTLAIHLVEMSLLDEHRYSPTLGYLHAAVAAAPDVAPRVQVHKHIAPSTATGEAALVAAVLPDDVDAVFLVAFTVYFWNRPQTMAVASRIKAARPNAVIVVGGNDVTNQQAAVFAEAPAVDVLVHGEGELRFVEVVRNVVLGRDPIEGVSGLSAVRAGVVVTTPAAERITELDSIPSPLLEPVYDDADLAGTRMIIYETNRGCPYSCAFCFWGGATNAKVRQFSLERVAAELDRIVRTAAPNAHLFVADANFGILGRDLDIVRIFVDLCAKYDKRITFMTNWAKNSNSKVVEIAEILHTRGMLPAVTLSAQSFDTRTLELAHRGNIKSDRYDTLLTEFRDRGIPTYTDLIWGLPGETLSSHLSGVERVLQAGGCPVVWPLLLLNNTEYASDTFGAQHPLIVERRPGDVSNPDLVADVVLGHPDLSQAEWRRGNLHAAATGVFAKAGMRCTLRYLSHVGGVRIVDLVDAVIDLIEAGEVPCPGLREVQQNYADALADPARFDEQLLVSILGPHVLHEEMYYQAMLRLVLRDAGTHREVLEWLTKALVRRFELAGRPGLELLSGVRTLDLAAGAIWRSALVGKRLSGMFAVHPRALAVLVDSGDVPDWGFDPHADAVQGRFASPRERATLWLSMLDLKLVHGYSRLLWEGDVKLLHGGARKDAAS